MEGHDISASAPDVSPPDASGPDVSESAAPASGGASIRLRLLAAVLALAAGVAALVIAILLVRGVLA